MRLELFIIICVFLLKDKPKDPKQDSFAEKLATNVIKNLQVEISDIHVRYEDHFTNPKKPFAVGVTLRGLSFQVIIINYRDMFLITLSS